MNKKALILLGCFILSIASIAAQGRKAICINEVMVQNDSNYVDDYGKHQAWIELFNSSFAPIDIASMYLTNDKSNPKKYPVPRMDVNTELPPRQHIIFWADGEPNKGTFHVNFTLTPGEENWIGLYDADGKTLIDEVTIPATVGSNQSYARKQDGIKNADNDAEAWELRDGSDEKYITPSSNNIIIDSNAKIEMFKEHDESGVGLTVLSMAIVFSSLLILCLCFRAIGKANQRVAKRKKEEAGVVVEPTADTKLAADSGEEIAAICMALHEHLNMHDHEDFVLTINKVKRAYSPWSSKIYSLRELPHK